jgi:hypothetical protein
MPTKGVLGSIVHTCKDQDAAEAVEFRLSLIDMTSAAARHRAGGGSSYRPFAQRRERPSYRNRF